MQSKRLNEFKLLIIRKYLSTFRSLNAIVIINDTSQREVSTVEYISSW